MSRSPVTSTRNRLKPAVERTAGHRRGRTHDAARDEVQHRDRLEDVEHDPDVRERRLERVPVELREVPVRGEQQRAGEHEVALHDPAQAEPVALDARR